MHRNSTCIGQLRRELPEEQMQLEWPGELDAALSCLQADLDWIRNPLGPATDFEGEIEGL
jgi:hypothetical protein